jgi:hypothetical protein
MNDEAGVEHAGGADATAEPEPGPIEPAGPGSGNPHEPRLRRLMGRTTAYPGPIVAITRCWVSRDSNLHVFAARFLDFAVLTPDHLMLCSTGFFTRRPRRRVFREPINRLVVIPRGPEPTRTIRIAGDFSHPLLFEIRDTPDGALFAHELVNRTRLPDPPPPSTDPTAP